MLLIYLSIFNLPVQASESGWIVLISGQSGTANLTQKQVMSLFLGRSRYLPDGDKVTALDHPIESEIRASFYRALTGKNISDIDAYWARLKYSGRASPPLPVETSEEIIEILSQEPGVIAYLPATYKDTLAKMGILPVLTM